MIVYLYIQEIIGYGVLLVLYDKLQKEPWITSVKIIRNLCHVELEKDIIIPVDVISNKNLFDKFGNLYYEMLDDKIDFYNYLYWNEDLLGNIRLIPFYDKTFHGKNKTQKFILKHRKGQGSMYNKIVSRPIYTLIHEYADTHQIQEFINADKTIAVDGFCSQGKIQSLFYSVQKGPLFFKDYKDNGFSMEYCTTFPNKEICNFIKSLLDRISYHGFFQFEFLLDQQQEIYILECNPRISGHVFTQNYYSTIILPYLLKSNNSIENQGEDHFPPFWTQIPKLLGSIVSSFFSCKQ